MLTLLGLRTVIYPAPDLQTSKAWFSRLLDLEPYFDQAFYVGFQVAGYELALDPAGDPSAGAITYWGLADADQALKDLMDNGANPDTEVRDVGDSIRVATVREPGGSVLGVIENPHYQPTEPMQGEGPGR